MRAIGRWALFLGACVSSLGISLIASSRFLESDRPYLASTIYPLNVEAVLTLVVRALSSESAAQRLDDFEEQIRRQIPTNAGDARLYSVLGEIYRQRGNTAAANAMFGHALHLAKTEVNALKWDILRLLTDGDYASALNQLDVMFRRWPDNIVSIAPVLPEVFSDQEAYPLLLRRLEQLPPWRIALLRALSAGNGPNLDFASQLIIDLTPGAAPPSNAEIAQITSPLFSQKQYDAAYLTFLLTLSPEQRPLSGFIFNGSFAGSPSARHFDWNLRSQPGVKVNFGSPSTGLSIEFANTPVRGIGVEQYLSLPPGDYQFEANMSAEAAHLPKSLFWTIDCADPTSRVLSLEIDSGDYRDRVKHGKFSVIPGSCRLYVLRLQTTALAENWNDRYRGRVFAKNVRIETVPL
ncbi:hypothetical protein [Mesorhizobium sp. J428]|uniref:hypothetical protein n=1 Tax=Mesorhizobium sp. J428 TaxID=2898440 RepID=UPI002151B52B|nr:hypothetical protein [Mesorhizobium sp. J428]MCR5858288.1 hypothetical protein [Mesorhizobium sp. J428]